MAAISTAGGLWYGYYGVAAKIPRVPFTPEPEGDQRVVVDGAGNPVEPTEEAASDLTTENFLMVGTDSRDCRPEDPKFAGGFGDAGGDNTDTMMLVRLDPVAQQAAIVSFPRDLWIVRPDNGSHDRINALFDPTNADLLADGIRQNFGVRVDHYIEINFCGFRDIVNAVGGVRIPFEFPARDENTGLNVTAAGCSEFNGDHALAYARSRHYQWQDAEGDWHDDPTGDYGRVARQQDFVRRVLRKAVDRGATNPSGLNNLLSAAKAHVTLDPFLSIRDLYDWGRALRAVPPETVRTFTILGHGARIDGKDVQEFDLTEPENADIIAVFSGQATLAPAAPDDTVPTTDTTAPPTDSTAPTTTVTPGAPPTVAPSETNDQNAESIVPPIDPNCT